MKDKMTRLEKAALTSAVSGAVFNVFLFGIGATLETAGRGSDLFVARIIAAILQAAAFDLVAIAVVMGMRNGRRSRWSMATAIASALVSAAIALDVAGVMAMPWLHAANALIVLAFTLHLLTPPVSGRAPQLRRLIKRLCARIRQERQIADYNLNTLRTAAEQQVSRIEQDRAAVEHRLNTAEQSVNSLGQQAVLARATNEQARIDYERRLNTAEQEHEHLRENARQTIARYDQGMKQLDQELNILRRDLAAREQEVNELVSELNRRPPPVEVEVIEVARARLTLDQAAALFGSSVSTIRRRLTTIEQEN